jgi:periplasmic copper chaperone A
LSRKSQFAWTIALLAALLPALAGTLTITNAWSRSTPPGVKVGVVYFTLKNDSGKSDRLLKISSPIAEKAQVHRTEILDGIARMREVAVLHVDAGETVEFAPNGMHLMLMGLKRPLVEGQTFDLELQFEVAGTRKVAVAVRKD